MTFNAGKIKLFLNGNKIQECNFNKPLYSNNEPLFISKSYAGGLEVFYGIIDEVRIYNRALYLMKKCTCFMMQIVMVFLIIWITAQMSIIQTKPS